MIGAVWVIAWRNPYIHPPAGMPKVLAEFYYDADDPRARGNIPEEVLMYYRRNNLFGSGYCIQWQADSYKPNKELSPDKLSRLRKNRLRRKIEKKYPLFVEEIVREEIMKKPAYYDGVIDQERINVLEREESRLRRLLEERVVIYWEGTK